MMSQKYSSAQIEQLLFTSSSLFTHISSVYFVINTLLSANSEWLN